MASPTALHDLAIRLRALCLDLKNDINLIGIHLVDLQRMTDQVEALDQYEPAPELPTVPYRSQWDADAIAVKSDCGPACVAMLLGYRNIGVRIDDLTKEAGLGPSKKYTTAADLARLSSAHGVKLETVTRWTLEQFARAAPCILLVHYGSIPGRMDAGYIGGHWIVLLGVVGNEAVYHDPDWWGPSRDLGASRKLDAAKMTLAMRDCSLDGNSAGTGLVMVVKSEPGKGHTAWLVDRESMGASSGGGVGSVSSARCGWYAGR